MPAFLLAPLTKYLVYLALLVAVIAFTFFQGMSFEAVLRDAELTRQAQDAVVIVRKQEVLKDRIVTKWRTRTGEIMSGIMEAKKEIERHVDEKPGGCRVPVWVVRVRNHAVGVPASDQPGAGLDGDADSGLACDDLARVLEDDAEQYATVAATLTALQQFIRERDALLRGP